MKKWNDILIPKQISKYSDKFYSWTLLRSSLTVVLLSSILLLFFMWKTVDSRFSEEHNALQSTNETCYSNINEVLNNAQNISMFFALYKDFSPLYQAESQLNVREIMLRQEMIAYTSCFDYLNGIHVKTRDAVVTHKMETNAEYKKVAYFDPFTLYATTENSYPKLLKLSYTSSNLDTFDVDITLYSEYLSTHYMPEDSYLLTKDGSVLLAREHSLIGKHISEVLSVDMDELCNNVIASDYLCANKAFSDDNMVLISVIPKTTIYSNTIGQLLSILLIFIIIMAIIFLLLAMTLSFLYRPIKDVAQVLKYYMPSNDSMLESDADFIKNCMKRYATNEDVDNALLQIRKSQLQTLQAQISPHILGNTLESIKWDLISLTGDDSKLVASIGSLSMLLEESYAYQRIITTIGAEIEQTKNFADMMVNCFYERMQIEWIVSEEILDCSIVNLTLQPFIENCFNHGFNRTEEHPLITIHIAESDGIIFVEIEDNGMGMDQKTLSNIKETLVDDGPCEHHIGIKNSHLKLKLLFGVKYGVTDIQSSEAGTYIKLELPKMKAPTPSKNSELKYR